MGRSLLSEGPRDLKAKDSLTKHGGCGSKRNDQRGPQILVYVPLFSLLAIIFWEPFLTLAARSLEEVC